MKKYKSEQGFTLMEVLIVLFIIGIIIAIALPNLKSARERAREKADSANRRMIGAQADQFFLEFGRYPSSVGELVQKNYLRSIPTCPGGKGKYVINRTANTSSDKRVNCQ